MLIKKQCKCWSKAPHDLHCWYCNLPVIVSISREVFLSQHGHSVTICDEEKCQQKANESDKKFGIPAVEVLRRRTNGIRKD